MSDWIDLKVDLFDLIGFAIFVLILVVSGLFVLVCFLVEKFKELKNKKTKEE